MLKKEEKPSLLPFASTYTLRLLKEKGRRLCYEEEKETCYT